MPERLLALTGMCQPSPIYSFHDEANESMVFFIAGRSVSLKTAASKAQFYFILIYAVLRNPWIEMISSLSDLST